MNHAIFGENIQGASHIRSGTPCQDSWKMVSLDDGTIILAVADGHGSKTCPYSDTGSSIAVDVFCDILQKLYEGYAENPDQLPSYLNREGDLKVAMAIDTEWKGRVVERHISEQREIEKQENGEDNLAEVYKQYGSTLLGLMITKNYVFGFQLGDGDICYVNENELQLVIEPEKILGVETHSLSRENSWEKAITAVRWINIGDNLPALFTLSSDGYANSYKSEEEFHNTIKDYLETLKTYGVNAVKKSLPGWLSETSEMGCGDDITMVIAYFTEDAIPEDDVSEESASEDDTPEDEIPTNEAPVQGEESEVISDERAE